MPSSRLRCIGSHPSVLVRQSYTLFPQLNMDGQPSSSPSSELLFIYVALQTAPGDVAGRIPIGVLDNAQDVAFWILADEVTTCDPADIFVVWYPV
jgi:hypothetical protein